MNPTPGNDEHTKSGPTTARSAPCRRGLVAARWTLAGLLLVPATLLPRLLLPPGVAQPREEPSATPRRPPVRAEARVVARPGREVTLRAEIAGTVARIPAAENRHLAAGDLVAELSATELTAAATEARARVAETIAEASWAERELERQVQLRSRSAVTDQVLERARHEVATARARRDQAAAAVQRAEVLVRRTRVVSPIDGTVVAKLVSPGEYVAPGTPLATLADLAQLRIEAEVDEFDIARIEVPARVTIRVEGRTDRTWEGQVEEVPPMVGPRGLRPQDPGRPIDTRVSRVKIACPDLAQLKLGQRVEVEIEGRPE